ncbi:MAG: hypothetical protein ACKVPX_03060 [Myxococcaceae bacterium]
MTFWLFECHSAWQTSASHEVLLRARARAAELGGGFVASVPAGVLGKQGLLDE